MLSYTAEVLQSLLVQYNRALWPGQLLAGALSLLAVLLVLRPRAGQGRALGLLMAAAWLWVGCAFYFEQLAAIDFSAPFYGGAFLLQGLLLLWSGVLRGRFGFALAADLFGVTGLVLLLTAVILLPVATALLGQGWLSVQMAGLMPLPTVLFTLGLLLLTAGRLPLHLAVIPLIWAFTAGATAWILGMPLETALTALCLAGLGLLVWKSHNRAPGAA